MKKLLLALTMGLLLAGLAGCKDETPAEKIEDGTMGLEKEAEEKAAEIKKEAPTTVPEDITEEPVEIPVKPKDHPAH